MKTSAHELKIARILDCIIQNKNMAIYSLEINETNKKKTRLDWTLMSPLRFKTYIKNLFFERACIELFVKNYYQIPIFRRKKRIFSGG